MKIQLLPIDTDARLDAAIVVMKDLGHPRRKLSDAEAGYLRVLTSWIREYESKHYAPVNCTTQELVEATRLLQGKC